MIEGSKYLVISVTVLIKATMLYPGRRRKREKEGLRMRKASGQIGVLAWEAGLWPVAMAGR